MRDKEIDRDDRSRKKEIEGEKDGEKKEGKKGRRKGENVSCSS